MEVTMKSLLFSVSIFLLAAKGNCDIGKLERKFIKAFNEKGGTEWKWNLLDTEQTMIWNELCVRAVTAAKLDEGCESTEFRSSSKRSGYQVVFKVQTDTAAIPTDMIFCQVSCRTTMKNPFDPSWERRTSSHTLRFYLSEGVYILQADDTSDDNEPVHIIGYFKKKLKASRSGESSSLGGLFRGRFSFGH